jgi:hypothetical protein
MQPLGRHLYLCAGTEGPEILAMSTSLCSPHLLQHAVRLSTLRHVVPHLRMQTELAVTLSSSSGPARDV